MRFNLTPALLALAALCMGPGLPPQDQPARQQAPPEQEELLNARRIAKIPDRLKELQRIKAAHPNSAIGYSIDSALLAAAGQNAGDLAGVLAAQGEIIDASGAKDRFWLLIDASGAIMGHRKASEFSGPAALKAIQGYKDRAMALLAAPGALARVPEAYLHILPPAYRDQFEVPLAMAQLKSGDGKAAIATLKGQGPYNRNALYYKTLGEACLEQGRDREALVALLQAAADGNLQARRGARAAYAKINGSDAGFESLLQKTKETRPFDPPPFKPPAGWKGKAVLAEVFTGSECTPCVAAAFGFGSLEDGYPAQYLAVLKYHLPIPKYDPMMNPAAQKRQDYYGVKSTPTAIIDGTKPIIASGGYASSYNTYARAKNEVDALLGAAPEIAIKAAAAIDGDKVTVDCEFSNIIEGADYNVVLAQAEEEFKGYNGIRYHKMVVRDMEAISGIEALKASGPAGRASVAFDLPESEKLAGEYIAEWGKAAQRARLSSTQWPLQRSGIDRSNLKAVVFVQDRESKQVYNAFVADVAN